MMDHPPENPLEPLAAEQWPRVRPAGEPPGSEPPSRLSAEQRRIEVGRLIRAGAPYRVIAERLHCSLGTVASDFKIIIQELRDQQVATISEFVVQQIDRLNALLFAVWGNALRGDEKAIDQALKILDRMAAVYGINRANVFVEANLTQVNVEAATPSSNPAMPNLAALTEEQLKQWLELNAIMNRGNTVIDQHA